MSEAAKIYPLKPQSLEHGVHAYQQYSCRVPSGTSPDDLLKPEFWAFVVSKFSIGAEIRVIPNDFSYRAVLLVTFTDTKNIRLKMIEFIDLDDTKPEIKADLSKDYHLSMRGQQKWCIQRLKDGEFIRELIPTKQEAILWLDKYILSMDGDADAQTYLDSLDY